MGQNLASQFMKEGHNFSIDISVPFIASERPICQIYQILRISKAKPQLSLSYLEVPHFNPEKAIMTDWLNDTQEGTVGMAYFKLQDRESSISDGLLYYRAQKGAVNKENNNSTGKEGTATVGNYLMSNSNN